MLISYFSDPILLLLGDAKNIHLPLVEDLLIIQDHPENLHVEIMRIGMRLQMGMMSNKKNFAIFGVLMMFPNDQLVIWYDDFVLGGFLCCLTLAGKLSMKRRKDISEILQGGFRDHHLVQDLDHQMLNLCDKRQDDGTMICRTAYIACSFLI